MIDRISSWALAMGLVLWSGAVAAEEAPPPGGDSPADVAASGEHDDGEAAGEGADEEPEARAANGEREAPATPPPTTPPTTPATSDDDLDARPPMPHVESPPNPEQVIPLESIRGPLVMYETAWDRGVGFLVRNRRTVVVLGGLRDRYRRITCRMANDSESPQVRVARVEVATEEDPPFVILHLEEELPGTPLRLSRSAPEVGDSVYLILRHRGPMPRGRGRPGARMTGRGRDRGVPDALEPAEASVTSASATTITVGIAYPQIWNGSPLFDHRGRVVAFFGSGGYAVRAEHILAAGSRRPGRQRVTPIYGIRLGTEFEGTLDDPVAVDVEAGVALWDQMAVLLRLGVGFGNDATLPLPADAAHESGLVEADQRTVALSLEVKYRLLLTRAAMPLYLDVVMGLQYSVFISAPHGVALYATTPACDPFGQACDLTVGVTPGRQMTHGIGPVFGVDVRAGIFTMGYRFVAEALAYQIPDTHRLTFGLTFR